MRTPVVLLSGLLLFPYATALMGTPLGDAPPAPLDGEAWARALEAATKESLDRLSRMELPDPAPPAPVPVPAVSAEGFEESVAAALSLAGVPAPGARDADRGDLLDALRALDALASAQPADGEAWADAEERLARLAPDLREALANLAWATHGAASLALAREGVASSDELLPHALAIARAADAVRGSLAGAALATGGVGGAIDPAALGLDRAQGQAGPTTATGDVIYQSPNRVLVIGGPDVTVYGGQHWLTVDLGGDDFYYDTAGGAAFDAATRTGAPVSVAIDLGYGNDKYVGASGYQGSGSQGTIGILADQGGDDVYSALDRSMGSGATGVGILVDLSGKDTYSSRVEGQARGSAAGVGILVDVAGDDTHSAGDRSLASSEGGLSVYLDVQGNDTYAYGARSRGFGAAGAIPGQPSVPVNAGPSVFFDASGRDYYAGEESDNTLAATGTVGVYSDFAGTPIVIPGSLAIPRDLTLVNLNLIVRGDLIVPEGVTLSLYGCALQFHTDRLPAAPTNDAIEQQFGGIGGTGLVVHGRLIVADLQRATGFYPELPILGRISNPSVVSPDELVRANLPLVGGQAGNQGSFVTVLTPGAELQVVGSVFRNFTGISLQGAKLVTEDAVFQRSASGIVAHDSAIVGDRTQFALLASGITITDSTLDLTASEIRQTTNTAIDATRSDVRLTGTSIADARIGIRAEDSTVVHVDGSLVRALDGVLATDTDVTLLRVLVTGSNTVLRAARGTLHVEGSTMFSNVRGLYSTDALSSTFLGNGFYTNGNYHGWGWWWGTYEGFVTVLDGPLVAIGNSVSASELSAFQVLRSTALLEGNTLANVYTGLNTGDTDVVARANFVQGARQGIYMNEGLATIESNTFASNGDGVTLVRADGTVTSNDFDCNSYDGLFLVETPALVESNDFFRCGGTGLHDQGSSATIRGNAFSSMGVCTNFEFTYSLLEENTYTSCGTGIQVREGGALLRHNDVSGGGVGIRIAGYGPDSTVRENTVVDATFGVEFAGPGGIFAENVLSNNTYGVNLPYHSKEAIPKMSGNGVNGVNVDGTLRPGERVFFFAETATVAGRSEDSGRADGYRGALTYQGLVTAYDATVTLTGSDLSNNNWGVYGVESTLTVLGTDSHDHVSGGAYVYHTGGLFDGFRGRNNGYYGYGAYFDVSSPVVERSEFSGNRGNGIYVYFSTPSIGNSTITDNWYDGIYNYASSSSIHDSVIARNSNGVNTYLAAPILYRNTVASNGNCGLYSSISSPRIENNLLLDNTYWGLCSETSSPAASGNTFRGNGQEWHGGGVTDSGAGGRYEDNDFLGNSRVGLECRGTCHGLTVQHNNFVGNPVCGVSANQFLNAPFNWWGHASGPTAAGADKVCGPVAYFPFLKSPT